MKSVVDQGLIEEGEAFRRMNERGAVERYDVVVIGAGQAGLSVGYHLRERGLRFLILDGNARIGDVWRTTYRFDLQPQQPIDYEPTNWYLSTWPGSRFVTALMAARATEDRQYALAGRRLSVHHIDGRSDRRDLADVTELRATLERDFLIDTAALPGLDAAFDRLP